MTNKNEDSKRRIDEILSGSYTENLDTKSEKEIRELRDTAREIETEMSYLRRLAQSRLDIFKAEQNRREKGGTLGDLIAMLPSILASGETRSSSTNSRWLKSVNPDVVCLQETKAQSDQLDLKEFEKEVSQKRKDLHKVIDALEGEIAKRTTKK